MPDPEAAGGTSVAVAGTMAVAATAAVATAAAEAAAGRRWRRERQPDQPPEAAAAAAHLPLRSGPRFPPPPGGPGSARLSILAPASRPTACGETATAVQAGSPVLDSSAGGQGGGCFFGSCSGGDTHDETADRTHFDFQAAGEFLAATSESGAVQVQVRQQPVLGGTVVTFNTAVVALVNGDRVGVYSEEPSFLVVNGAAVAPRTSPSDCRTGARSSATAATSPSAGRTAAA